MCSVKRVESYINEFVKATRIVFTKDSSYIIVVTRRMTLEVASLFNEQVSHIQTITLAAGKVFDNILLHNI